MDLGLLQREVADGLGLKIDTLRNWEADRTAPSIRLMPRVIAFLGYDPIPSDGSIAAELLACRRAYGLTRDELAARLGVDPSTLWRWKVGVTDPGGELLERVRNIHACFAAG